MLPFGRRLKHRLLGVAVNGATLPLWKRVARACPDPFEALAQRIYLQLYQCEKRAHLRREARAA